MQIMTNFGSSKTDLNLKYRLGLEHALAKADFLNVPDIVLVQAFAIFLFLVRRHDSPRFVWMMTGLIIRMAQSLGLQRDGAYFAHLTPFEIEQRRKVWWAICILDLRASEDQGTDLTITDGSFDTRIPLYLDDADFGPESKETPTERDGVTQLPFACICDLTRKMMAPSMRDGALGLEDQSRLLNEICQRLEQGFLQHATGSGKILHWGRCHRCAARCGQDGASCFSPYSLLLAIGTLLRRDQNQVAGIGNRGGRIQSRTQR